MTLGIDRIRGLDNVDEALASNKGKAEAEIPAAPQKVDLTSSNFFVSKSRLLQCFLNIILTAQVTAKDARRLKVTEVPTIPEENFCNAGCNWHSTAQTFVKFLASSICMVAPHGSHDATVLGIFVVLAMWVDRSGSRCSRLLPEANIDKLFACQAYNVASPLSVVTLETCNWLVVSSHTLE